MEFYNCFNFMSEHCKKLTFSNKKVLLVKKKGSLATFAILQRNQHFLFICEITWKNFNFNKKVSIT